MHKNEAKRRDLAPRPYVSASEKTQRAFGAYTDLMEAADWLRERLRGQLAFFDMTPGQFRILEMLRREGPTHQAAIAHRLGCSDATMAWMIKRVERKGWVWREAELLPSVRGETDGTGAATVGRRVVVVCLTEKGEERIAYVYSKHVKVVKADMRVLEGREQETLSRVCRKLRQGDVMKFVAEITHEDREESGAGPPTR